MTLLGQNGGHNYIFSRLRIFTTNNNPKKAPIIKILISLRIVNPKNCVWGPFNRI